MDTQATGPTSIETLFGGVEVPITMLDGTAGRVTVRQLPIRVMPALLLAQDDEAASIELYCDKPAGWADTITRDSAERIVVEGERINADFFARWLARRVARYQRAAPWLVDSLNSPAPSPASPSKPA